MSQGIGPLLSQQVALRWAVAFLLARFVLSRVAGRSGRWLEGSPAKRGFRAGLRLTLLVVFLLLIWWANRTPAGP